ncbi:hypothetical protein JRO89_XS03G0226600 [Xanthoceras sorbifolium]|uniref:Pectin acetylesterase n=1 Tax=Xanthoceras sorbifolium TaxID=99658 RepID=A0ABQ8IBC8_9ROSI|nr:hypothetical protein JRO89_XS03G0226600 [Xanthoceras sorbifolium]
MECSSSASKSKTSPAFIKLLWVYGIVGLLLCKWVNGFNYLNATADHNVMSYGFSRPLMVGLTYIHGAAAKGAVCLDGTLPGYHIHRGYGSGANSWLIMLEAAQLYFRGQRIWSAAMEDLKSKGMRHAKQALLAGCSAGGLATILHCDEFRKLFPRTTRVKCLSDAGLFLDIIDISGVRTSRNKFWGVVSLQKVQNLPRTCTKHLNPILHSIASVKTPLFLLNAAYDTWQIQASLAPPSADPHGRWHECRNNFAHCSASQIQFLQGFRNQMLYAVRGLSKHKKNGIFINSCFAHCQTERQDTWFDQNSPSIRNKACSFQLYEPQYSIILHYYVSGTALFALLPIISSCFITNKACLASSDALMMNLQRIAEYVGDWYFDRVNVKAIDCPYPCDNTCHNLVFRGEVP